MKILLKTALAAALIAGAGSAAAQPYDHSRDSRLEQRQDRYERHEDRQERRADRREQRREQRYNAGRYRAPHGYQARSWHRGERLPPSYRARGYVVDHRHYGLRAPPRGYQYVRVDNDVVLTAVATGVITSVIVNLFQ